MSLIINSTSTTDVYAQTTHPSIHKCRQGEVVEEISEIFPHIRIAVLSQTFVVKSVDLGDLSTLMIASEDGNSVWESNLQATANQYC
jgi:hypothetical protein